MKRQVFMLAGLGVVLGIMVSCREPPRSTVSSPAHPTSLPATVVSPPASQPQVVNTVDAEGKATIQLPNKWGRDPARYPAGWLTVEALFKPDSSASAEGEVLGGSRLTVKTRNVRQIRLQLDDPSLSFGSRAGRPLELDGQVFEITAKSGPVLHFERKLSTGQWAQMMDNRK
jgi:hypothetical protein